MRMMGEGATKCVRDIEEVSPKCMRELVLLGGSVEAPCEIYRDEKTEKYSEESEPNKINSRGKR